MAENMQANLVSVHGGHSGQFCSHAQNSLADIVDAYATKGFQWVGITEHMPAIREEFVPPEEREEGLEMGITVVPGDDSHGLDGVGLHLDQGIRILTELGANTQWRMPVP